MTGLIRPALIQSELEYLFRHALVQEAAYNSLVKSDRRNLHRAAGQVLERVYPDRVEELAPRLAIHYQEAGMTAQALRYFTVAGDAAARIYANAEAAMHYGRALEIARTQHAENKAGDEEDGVKLRYLYQRLGRSLEESSQLETALRHYSDMQTQGQIHHDREMELAALTARATLYGVPSSVQDQAEARSLSLQALNMARAQGDRAAEAKILWNLMLAYRSQSRFSEALDVGEKSLELALELGLRTQLAYTLNDLSEVYASTGQVQRARQALREAGPIWRESNNLPMLADNLGRLAAMSLWQGLLRDAVQASEQALELSRQIGSLWGESFSQMFVGEALFELGEPERAIQSMEESIRVSKLAGFVAPQFRTRAALAQLLGELGAVDRGLELAQQAREIMQQGSYPVFAPAILGVLARLYLRKNFLERAEALVHEARGSQSDEINPLHAGLIPVALCELHLARQDYQLGLQIAESTVIRMRDTGLQLYLPFGLYLTGVCLYRCGRAPEALEVLGTAREVAEATGARHSLWQILSALAQAEEERGRAEEARKVRSQSRQIVESIADHCPPDLRTSFLAMPEVRQVLR